MSRLVVVSNRIAPVGSGKPPQGGLAVALLEALQGSGGLWLGWSGQVSDNPAAEARVRHYDKFAVAEVDLTQDEYDQYYLGYSNGTLWPAFHYRLDLMTYSRPQLAGYRAVNRRFATALKAILQPEDIVWVHDYHLIPLAAALRAEGVTNPIGFFLHIPVPAHEVMVGVPGHAVLMEQLAAYDLVGLQTERDVVCFSDYLLRENAGKVGEGGWAEAYGRRFRVVSFPISIETEAIAKQAAGLDDVREVVRLRESLGERRLMIGVDRLDYSKGLTLRFKAFEDLLSTHHRFRHKVSLMQIAPPTRSELHQYQHIKEELERNAGRINGAYAEYDWMPIRYINRAYSRDNLMAFFRASAIGLVTPLRDGMNLVAKEYVAAQNPEKPGVLVLSRFAGAAEEMEGALIVNPFNIQSVSDSLARALDMSVEERRERYDVMMKRLRSWDIGTWCAAYQKTLEGMRAA